MQLKGWIQQAEQDPASDVGVLVAISVSLYFRDLITNSLTDRKSRRISY